MKIGIDARLYEAAGPGRYIRNLIRELEQIDNENDYIIFVTGAGSKLYHPQNPKFKKWISDYKIYSMEEQTMFLRDLIQARLDLLHVPHFNVPALYPRKVVVTIHDLIMHKFAGKKATTLPGPSYFFKNIAYKLVTIFATKKATRIIVPSETVKNDIQSFYSGINPKKIIVTYEGVDDSLLKLSPIDTKSSTVRLEEMKITNKYLLYVGSSYIHKNLNILLIAYRDFLEKSATNLHLVVAGRIDNFSQRLAGFAHALKLDGKVIFPARYSENEYVKEEDLAILYKNATAYVFPSLSEGFSITPLEAQAFGIPVVLSDIPTHKEIFQDSVLYFNAESVIEITECLSKILSDENLRFDLIRKGNENVKRFSWKKMAEQTLQIYKESAQFRHKL